MARKVPRIVVFCLVVLMILLGAFRDFVFVNINYQLNYLWKEQDFSRAHSFFDFLAGYDYWTIYYWKFALTGIFALLYFVLTWTLIKVIFNNRKFQRYAVILFGSVVAMSLLLFGGGYLFGNAHFGYDLARHFMDVVQSPIAAMILIPIFLLIQNGMGAQKEQ
jgi:hypothetical protein